RQTSSCRIWPRGAAGVRRSRARLGRRMIDRTPLLCIAVVAVLSFRACGTPGDVLFRLSNVAAGDLVLRAISSKAAVKFKECGSTMDQPSRTRFRQETSPIARG